MRTIKRVRIILALFAVHAAGATPAATDWSAQDYDLYPGDFNGDYKTDLLYVAKSPERGSGVALSDGARPVAGHQVWNATGFGIPWHSNIYKPVIGDFNWDGRSDIFMHRQTPGDHYLLVANADGTFSGSNQRLINTIAELVLSGDQHRVISVKASVGTTRGHRLFLQSVKRGGSNAILNTSATQLITGSLYGTAWGDGHRGFQWNLSQAIVHSGDFDNDGQGDFLIQAKPDIVMIDYEIPIPVPHYRPLSFGIAYASGLDQFWNRQHAGVDWSANHATPIIDDFNGDRRDDVILQPTRGAGAVHLFVANGTTNQLAIDAPAALSFSGAASASGESYRIIAANINGSASERAAGVYLQATSTGGTDLIAHSIPVSGGSVSTTAQSQQYQSSPTPATAVGAIPASFSVDPSGASTYRIPIEVPPGIAGTKPELTLTYSSRSGNGLVGMGWTVSGLSAVTRCAMTFDQDGVTDGVDLDASEAYCLDGARLRVISGVNGALNSEYRTEIESFQRVKSQGGVAHDPGSWVVHDKAGLIRYYGTTADSRVELQGKSQAHVWAVKRIEDRYGNFIEYTYSENSAQSSFEPVDVRWGHGTGVSRNVVGRVHFEYWTTRPDPTSGYMAGSVVGNTKLLKLIDVFSRSSATVSSSEASRRVRTYFLNYETSPNTSLSHLKEVVLCDGGSGGSRRCVGSAKFRWQHGTPGFSAANTSSMPSSRQSLRPTDITGNGGTDYLWTHGGTSNIDYWGYSVSLGDVHRSTTWSTRGSPWNAIVIDYDSDGYQDLLQSTNYTSGTYEWFPAGSNGLGSSIATSISSAAFTRANTSTAVGDFDGDGTQDLVYSRKTFPSSLLKLHLNQPGGFKSIGTALPQGGTNYKTIQLNGVPWVFKSLGTRDGHENEVGTGVPKEDDVPSITTINFDGDGRDDVLVRVGTSCNRNNPDRQAYTYSCQGQRYNVYSYDPAAQALQLVWSHVVDASNPEWWWPKFFDANGDGLTDVAYATASGWKLRIGTGSAAQGLVQVWSASSFTGQFRVLDVETRRYFTETLTVSLDEDRFRYAQTADYDRDGRSDILFPETGRNVWMVLRNSGATGGFQLQGINTQMPVAGKERAMTVDDRGDGLPDLAYPDGSSFKVRYGRGPAAAGVIDRITDGLGAVTQVQYAPLTEQTSEGAYALYDRDKLFNDGGGATSAVSFPYQHVTAPITVVAQIAQDNGLGSADEAVSSVQTAYRYAGLKTHRRGRGLLGFSEVIAKNVNTTIVTVSEYAQKWPYTGMVTKSEQRYPDVTRVINRSSNLALSYPAICESSYYCPEAHVNSPVVVTVAGPPIATTVNTLADQAQPFSGLRFPYTLASTETVYPLQSSAVGGSALKRTKTEYLGQNGASSDRYDTYGNPYYIRVTVDDGEGGDAHITTTSNEYDNDATNWCLGRLRRVAVTHSKSIGLTGNTGDQSITRNSTFTYRAAPYCDLDVETIEPGTPLEQWTDHDYDSFGNRTSSTVGGYNVTLAQRRTTTANYTPTQGQFAQTIGNALGHQETITWDPRFGVKSEVTGPNGLISSVVTDSFGRVTSEIPIQGLGVYKNTSLLWCAYTGCYDSRSVTVIVGTGSDGSQVRTEFDRLNRETRSGKLALDGRWLWTEKHYDPLGREYLASQPYFNSSKRCWTFRRFDLLGRVTYQRDAYKTGDNSDGECGSSIPSPTATDPELPGGTSGGRLTMFDHDLIGGSLIGTRTTAHSNDVTARRVALKWVNVFGRTRSVQDELTSGACASSSTNSSTCIATFYDHDAQGNLTLVRQSGQIATGASTSQVTIDTVASFNARGFKTGMTDPDMGSWSYGYNAFGELTSQTDAKGQQTVLDYDRLGRLFTRTEGSEGVTNWYYDETSIGGPHSTGKLTRVVGPGGSYEERYVYDDAGRLATTKRKIDGSWHRIDQTYDSQSRVDLLKYPAWTTTSNPDAVPVDAERVIVRHNYNTYGFLTSTQNASSGTTYWRIDTTDQYGVTQETLGNGVVTKRTFEATTGLLRSITAGLGSATAIQNQSFGFDRNGNLLRRADINLNRSEDFTYDAIDRLRSTRLFNNASWSGTPASTEGVNYDVFGNITAKGSYTNYNHVINTSGASLCNAAANPTAQPHAVRQVTAGSVTRTMCYDRNGNMVRQINGQYDTVTWWVANLARRIGKGTDYAEFTYAPDRARYKQVAVKAGISETTLYVGGVYERATKSGTTEHTYYIKGGAGAIAITKCVGACSQTTSTTKYLHRDHLGSVVALSNGAGVVESADRMSFDAWGKRRANTWTATTPGVQILASTYTSFTKRGFTGHEHLDFLGVVHMNGRIYDSEIGRFLSADPFVQFPESTQGLNRYSYVDNNPLTNTDPSGFLSFRQALGMLVQGVLTWFFPQFAPLWGAVGGAIAGGTKGAMVGFVTAGFGMGTAGLGVIAQAVAQGIVGGIISAGMGGKFQDGFIGGMAGSLAGSAIGASPLGSMQGASGAVLRIMVRGVVGGTVSEISGGTFANGAASAAFNAALQEARTAMRTTSERNDNDRGYFARKKLLGAQRAAILTDMRRAAGDIRGKPFASIDLAVQALHVRMLPISEQHNVEIGALVFTGGSADPNSYYISEPVTDFKPDEVALWGTSTGPTGSSDVARWHTHPGAYTADFSKRDIANAVAPPGLVASYVSYTSPYTGQDTLLRFSALAAASAPRPYADRAKYTCTVVGFSGAYAGC